MGELSSIMIEILLVSGILMGISIFASDLDAHAGTPVDNLTSNATHFIDVVKNRTDDIRNQTIGAKVDTGWKGWFSIPSVLLFGTWSVVSNSVGLFTDLSRELVGNFAFTLQMPSWFITIIVAIVAITLVFVLIKITVGRDI